MKKTILLFILCLTTMGAQAKRIGGVIDAALTRVIWGVMCGMRIRCIMHGFGRGRPGGTHGIAITQYNPNCTDTNIVYWDHSAFYTPGSRDTS